MITFAVNRSRYGDINLTLGDGTARCADCFEVVNYENEHLCICQTCRVVGHRGCYSKDIWCYTCRECGGHE